MRPLNLSRAKFLQTNTEPNLFELCWVQQNLSKVRKAAKFRFQWERWTITRSQRYVFSVISASLLRKKNAILMPAKAEIQACLKAMLSAAENMKRLRSMRSWLAPIDRADATIGRRRVFLVRCELWTPTSTFRVRLPHSWGDSLCWQKEEHYP